MTSSVLLEDIGDGAASDLMSQIGQSPLDSGIAPGGILQRHAQNEMLADFSLRR